MNTANRKLNTENFLNSYIIRQKLSEVSGYDENENVSVDLDGVNFETNPFDTKVACGQIRLLSDVQEIVYVAVLRKINAETFLIMPFSHYDFPATDREFKTDFDGGMYLNTLQTWNAKLVKLEFLKRSWLIGHLPNTDCKNALEFYDKKPLNKQLQERTGLPALSSDDIINKYLHEETLRIENKYLADEGVQDVANLSMLNRAKQLLFRYDFPSIFEKLKPQVLFDSSSIISSFAAGTPSSDFCLSLAAASIPQNISIRCKISKFTGTINIEYSPRKKYLNIIIFDASDEDLSTDLDGMSIIDESGNLLGVIEKGKCFIKGLENFNGRIAIQKQDGSVVIFKTNKNNS